MTPGLDYAVAVILIVFGPLLVVACLKVQPDDVKPGVLR